MSNPLKSFVDGKETSKAHPLMSFIEPEQEKSIFQEALSTAKNIGLGVAQRFTFPADIAQAIALENMREEEREALISGNKEGAQAAHEQQMRIAQEFPTQSNLEKKAEEKFGIELEPKTARERIERSFGTLGINPQGLIGALGEEGLKKIGVPDWIAGLVAGAGVGVARTKGKSAAPATAEAKELRNISTKHELPYMKGIENTNITKPAQISAKKHAKIEGNLGKASQEAVGKIIEKNIPVASLKKQGINLKDYSEQALKYAEHQAKTAKHPFYTKDLKDYLQNEMSAIKQKSPHLSGADQIVYKELETLNNKLVNPFYTAQEGINIYRALNEDLKSIYRKPQFTGAEPKIATSYEGVKKKIIDELDRVNPEVGKALKESNKIYHQRLSLEQTNKILDPVFANGYNPRKLNSILASSKGDFLKRNLGQQGVKELQEIAHYGNIAKQKILNRVDIAKPLEEQFRGLGFVGSRIFTAKKVLKVPGHLLKTARGIVLTSPKLRKDYKDFLKNAAKNSSLKSLQNSASKFENDLIEEFGSIDNLFAMAKEFSPDQERDLNNPANKNKK